MIIKEWAAARKPANKFEAAGQKAESQMAFYLCRAFENTGELCVLHDVRIVDETRSDANGCPRVAQIDHLVLHRWGAFIVESKSVAGTVTVRREGSGDGIWERRFNGRVQGMPSPIKQGQMQGDVLRDVLQDHREELLGKIMVGLRTYAKLVAKTEHRGFGQMPIQVIAAISNEGAIRGKQRPFEIGKFPHFLSKADLVSDLIVEQHARHKRAAALLGDRDGDFGMWEMKKKEVERVARFLADCHTPPKTSVGAQAVEIAAPVPERSDASAGPEPAVFPTPVATQHPACRACGGTTLTAKSGPYGYYWKCSNCDGNTPMPTVCSVCGVEGQRGRGVRIRKEGVHYYRCCEACSIKEKIWTERA